MCLLAIIDAPKKTCLVWDESGSNGIVVLVRMINLVKHKKKLSNALAIKPKLQHVKLRNNIIPTPLYTKPKMSDDEVGYVD